jgi:hypothetical protein
LWSAAIKRTCASIYEVVARTNGKEWGFEVPPNGKFVKKHGEKTMGRQ